MENSAAILLKLYTKYCKIFIRYVQKGLIVFKYHRININISANWMFPHLINLHFSIILFIHMRCGYKITWLCALYWGTCRSGEQVKDNGPWTFSNQTRLDSCPYVSWFAYELYLSVTMSCCSTRFVTRMKIKQHINLKFLVKLKKLR
jgi:hypothetical protein